jgi:hypothetical protein
MRLLHDVYWLFCTPNSNSSIEILVQPVGFTPPQSVRRSCRDSISQMLMPQKAGVWPFAQRRGAAWFRAMITMRLGLCCSELKKKNLAGRFDLPGAQRHRLQQQENKQLISN